MVMKPIRKQSVEELTTEVLRNEIVSGRLASSTRLTEMDLSSKLEVSRAPVRVALRQLVREGLVVQVPYTGWAVASLTAQDAWELFTLRACLEGMAARLATEHSGDEGKALIEAAYDQLCQASARGMMNEVAEADFAFHKQIILLAGHGRLAQQYALVEQQVRLSICSSNALLPDVSSVVEQHGPIARAILNGQADAAAQLSEQHSQSEGDKLVQHLRRQSGSSAPSAADDLSSAGPGPIDR